jgi:phosphate transport system protein
MATPHRSHILSNFSAALEALRGDVLMMKDLTERNFANAAKGFFDRDSSRCKVAIADDEEIDLLEMQVDRDGIELLTRFTPVAVDLRQVISAMKIGTNLERVGDQAVSIARRACKLNEEPPLAEVGWLRPMYQRSIEMFRDSFAAYANGDLALARSIRERDIEVDRMNHELTSNLTAEMALYPERARGLVNLIFVVRSLERLGDLSKNIAEDAAFAASAEDIRHPSIRRVEV